MIPDFYGSKNNGFKVHNEDNEETPITQEKNAQMNFITSV